MAAIAAPSGVYDGELKGGQRHGQGKCTYPNGDVYDGEWRLGLRHGQGKLTYAGGDEYSGEWKKNKRSGQGIIWAKHIGVYEGAWRNDQRCGDGVRCWTMMHPTLGCPSATAPKLGTSQWKYTGRHVANVMECGRWKANKLVESRPVLVGKLPVKHCFSAQGHFAATQKGAKRASLLFPGGPTYAGALNAQNQRHGQGDMYNVVGECWQSGKWINDVLQPATSDNDRNSPSPVASPSALPIISTPSISLVAPSAAAATANFSSVSPSAGDASGPCDMEVLLESATPAGVAPPPAPAAASTAASSVVPPSATSVSQVIAQLSSSSLAASAPSSSSAESPLVGRRMALLFGNSNYNDPQQSLSCSANDAEDMQTALERLKFTCVILIDGTRERILAMFNSWLKTLKKGDLVLFYFSGHGAESAGVPYLLASDYAAEGAPGNGAVSLNYIKHRLHKKNLTKIIVLDCCRSKLVGSGAEGGEVSKTSLQAAERNSFTAYSSEPGYKAAESAEDRNSLFTSCLLKHLDKPDLLIEQVFRLAEEDLRQVSRGQQRAVQDSHLRYDLKLCPANATASAQAAAASGSAVIPAPLSATFSFSALNLSSDFATTSSPAATSGQKRAHPTAAAAAS